MVGFHGVRLELNLLGLLLPMLVIQFTIHFSRSHSIIDKKMTRFLLCDSGVNVSFYYLARFITL